MSGEKCGIHCNVSRWTCSECNRYRTVCWTHERPGDHNQCECDRKERDAHGEKMAERDQDYFPEREEREETAPKGGKGYDGMDPVE